MKNNKIMGLAVVAILSLLLAACQPAAKVELDEIREALVEHIAASLRAQGYTDEDFEWADLPGMDIVDLTGDDLGVTTGVDIAFAIRAGMGLSPDDILIVKVSKGKAKEIKAMIETANQEKHDFFVDYNPAGAAKIKNAIVKVYGNYIVNIIFDDADAIDAVISKLFK